MLGSGSRWVDWEALARFLIAPVLVFIALMIDQSYLVDLWHHLAPGREGARFNSVRAANWARRQASPNHRRL
jgi:hypothetical protein